MIFFLYDLKKKSFLLGSNTNPNAHIAAKNGQKHDQKGQIVESFHVGLHRFLVLLFRLFFVEIFLTIGTSIAKVAFIRPLNQSLFNFGHFVQFPRQICHTGRIFFFHGLHFLFGIILEHTK
jgi:hypothetical protein